MVTLAAKSSLFIGKSWHTLSASLCCVFFFCQPCVAYQTRNFALSATKEDPQIDLMPSSAAMAVQRALPVDMEMSGVEKDACAPGC